MTGFTPDNQRWYENNPQKDSFNYIQDEAENNPLVNDCLKSERYRDFIDYLYQPGIEGTGYEDDLNKIDQPTHSGLSAGLYENVKQKFPEIAENYPQQLRDLHQAQVENVMCQALYKPFHVESINNDKFAKTYWDLVVNHKPSTFIPWVQQSINEIPGNNIRTDEIIGTESINAINAMTEDQLHQLNNNINNKRQQFFEEQNSPRFKRGLLKRNNNLRW